MTQFLSALLCLVVSGMVLHAAPETALPANATEAQIRSHFNSAGYRALKKTDAEFLSDLYRGILQREPDAEGMKTWLTALKNSAKDPKSREKAVEAFFKSPEFSGKTQPTEPPVPKKDTTRIAANVLFNKTGVFVNDATALPADRFAPLFKKAKIEWLTLQIDNGGVVRADNAAAIDRGWAKAWRAGGFKVGFWGCPRGVAQHNSETAVKEATPIVQADAELAVKLTVQYRGEFYLADCEDHYQGYNQTDPAPALNRVYVEAFEKAAAAAGLSKMPRALSSMGRVALDMKPWIDAGWDAMPQAYWNSYAVYQPSKCIDFYVKDAGWPIERVHPTIATYSGEGENRTVTLEEYAADLRTRATAGFSFYLPESYLKLGSDSGYEQLGRMAKP